MANPPPMILQSMTAKVLEIANNRRNYEIEMESKGWNYCGSDFEKCLNYAKFLTMPLELGFFVPVDKDGNVLEEPKKKDYRINKFHHYFLYKQDLEAYQQAKNNVIFEGFSYSKRNANGAKTYLIHNNDVIVSMPEGFNFNTTIESLIPYGLTITESAIKKYGL